MSDETPRVPDFEQEEVRAPEPTTDATPPEGGLDEVLEEVRRQPEPTPAPLPVRRSAPTVRPAVRREPPKPKVVAAKCPICGARAAAAKAGERAVCRNCSQEVDLQAVTE